MTDIFPGWVRDALRDPIDYSMLDEDAGVLKSRTGHVYQVVGSVPVMLPSDLAASHRVGEGASR